MLVMLRCTALHAGTATGYEQPTELKRLSITASQAAVCDHSDPIMLENVL